MKNYKQILEAIRKGIKLALDDYQDMESNSSTSSSNNVVNAKDVIQEYIDSHIQTVDMGLPSGTKWCKYNLGVNPKELNTIEDWYGNYYAWGEIKPKNEYTWDSYILGNERYLNKYVSDPKNSNYGTADNLKQLQDIDDAACQTEPIGKFCIPTREQFEELFKYCKYSWVERYKGIKEDTGEWDGFKSLGFTIPDSVLKGLNGVLFKSDNGNELFFPAAGSNNGFEPDYDSISGHYWTSSATNNPDDFYYNFSTSLYFLEKDIRLVESQRFPGFSIRPVLKQ